MVKLTPKELKQLQNEKIYIKNSLKLDDYIKFTPEEDAKINKVQRTKKMSDVLEVRTILHNKRIDLIQMNKEKINKQTNTKRTERVYTSEKNELILQTNNKNDLQNIYTPTLVTQLKNYINTMPETSQVLIRILGTQGWFTFKKSYLTTAQAFEYVANMNSVVDSATATIYALSISRI